MIDDRYCVRHVCLRISCGCRIDRPVRVIVGGSLLTGIVDVVAQLDRIIPRRAKTETQQVAR